MNMLESYKEIRVFVWYLVINLLELNFEYKKSLKIPKG